MPYSRYERFIDGGNVRHVPFVNIPKKDSDKYVEYDPKSNRLDLLSYQYYDDPNYGWLILQANPELGSMEYMIRRNTVVRVPYPLEDTLIRYASDIDRYEKLYGIH